MSYLYIHSVIGLLMKANLPVLQSPGKKADQSIPLQNRFQHTKRMYKYYLLLDSLTKLS